jgi:hypothetical protein
MRNNPDPGGADWSDMTGVELDENAADRLLDGAPAGPSALSRLLAAASAPGRATELAGEEDALAMFRAIRSPAPVGGPQYRPVPEPQPLFTGPGRKIRHHGRQSTWQRKVSVRLAVVGAALTAVAALGGVAVAAGVVPAGVVPAPLRNLVPNAPADPSQRGGPGHTAGGPSTGPGGETTTHEPGTGGPSTLTSPTMTPANLNGLCHSFQDAAAVDLQAALAEARFAVLVSLAGGADHVSAYCDKFINDHPTGKPDISPSPAPAGAPAKQ